MKKTMHILLAMMVVFMIFPVGVVLGTSNSLQYEIEANQLHEVGILLGTDLGLELDRELNRVEGSVMLVRLLGEENNALLQKNSHPFQDVPAWADHYVGFLYANELTQGMSATTFGSLSKMTASQYATFLLRAIGYDDSQGDFTWQQALLKATEIGMLSDAEVNRLTSKGTFLRDDMAGLSWHALNTAVKDTTETLVANLVQTGALDNTVVYKAGFPVKVTFSEFLTIVDGQQVIAELEDTTLTYQELLDLLEALDILEPGTADNAVNEQELLIDFAQKWILNKYLIQAAEADNFGIDESIIDEQIDFITLFGLQFTPEQERVVYNLFYRDTLAVAYISSLVPDDEVQAMYDNNLQEFTYASVRHILITTDGRKDEEALIMANQLVERIRQGEDMGDLAGEYTEDPGSAYTGGLYEDVAVHMWIQEFKEAALTFSIDEVGDPVKTAFGYHIIRVEDRYVEEFSDVKESIKQEIVQEYFANFMENAQKHTAFYF